MDKSSFLIDFSSPAQKHDLKPLIPIPPQTSLVPKEIEEPSIDPFEVQQLEAPDPFESVLQCAFNNSNSENTATEDPVLSLNSRNEKSEIQINCIIDSTNTMKIKNPENENKLKEIPSNNNELNQLSLESNQVASRNKIPEESKVDHEKSHVVSIENNKDMMENSPKTSATLENDNQSQNSADFSTDENLKAVIAKRVNRCIQEVLNGSLKTGKDCDNSVLKKPQNKRSLSFIGLSTVLDKKECDRLNKSCTDVNDTTFNLENQQLEPSSDSSGFGVLSSNSTDESAAEENSEDQVFKEARILSRTFSRLAESFRQEQVVESDSDDEDLMSCKPRWLYTDSSEDEGEKLLKDPSLNFRRRSDSSTYSLPAPQIHKVTDSPALLAYKSRRSLTQIQATLNNTQEEFKLKRSISVGSHLKEVPTIQTPATTVPLNLMKADDQPIKLKKNFGGMKKGPLRAVMPIQSMTKEPLLTAGKLSSKQDTSPEIKIHKPDYTLGTPVKDNSQLNITPMASSTPNKAESFLGSNDNTNLLIKPEAPVVNKRHSLESSFGSHKSRGSMTEGGARPRSSSASSSIPRVMQVKPFRGVPVVPKSTSNLLRTADAQVNTNNVKSVHEKKNKSHLKSSVNSRVLTEVKTRSPRQSKVKTAVNTLSNLVRGKKTAPRDKENRVPV